MIEMRRSQAKCNVKCLPVFKGPHARRVTATSDVLVLALIQHGIAVNVLIGLVLCVGPALDKAIFKPFGVRLSIVGFPVGDVRVSEGHLSVKRSYRRIPPMDVPVFGQLGRHLVVGVFQCHDGCGGGSRCSIDGG